MVAASLGVTFLRSVCDCDFPSVRRLSSCERNVLHVQKGATENEIEGITEIFVPLGKGGKWFRKKHLSKDAIRMLWGYINTLEM